MLMTPCGLIGAGGAVLGGYMEASALL